MKISSILISFCLLMSAAFAIGAAGQTSPPHSQPTRFAHGDQATQAQASCPTVKVSCPEELKPGEALKFTANVAGGDQNVETTYNWLVSAGSISSGQGTPTIEVDVSELPHKETVTAKLVVDGFARSCSTAASCTTTVSRRFESSKVDEYPTVTPDTENARLNAFAKQLQEKPDSQAYILVYGGRHSLTGAARAAANRIKSHLVKNGGIDANRIVTVDGGYKEELAIELWVVPPGALPPFAIPTVDPSEVTPKKPAAKPPSKRRKKP